MSARTFVLISNFYDVVNGIEDEPERILLPLDRIEMGLVFVHNGTTMVRLSIVDLDTDVTVDLDKLMKATSEVAAPVRWISAE